MISQWIHSHIKKNNGVTLDKLRSSDKMPGKRVEQPTSDIKKLQGKEGEILNGIGDAIVILDNELNIIWTNEFALKKWNAVPGKKCYQAIRSREDPCAICNARRTLTDGKVRSSEEDIVAKDGAYINFMITCSLIRDSIGERDWIAIVYHDTTNRKKAETRLKDSEEKYRNLVERANDGITIIQDGLVKYANPRHSEIMGYTIEELINTPFTDYIHPDKRPIVADLYKRRMAGEDVPKVYETVVKHKDGTDVDVEFNAGIITYQGEKADFVIVRDITERKLADNILKFRNIILSTQQETSLDGILVVDENRRIISFNQRFIDIWDIPAEVIESNSDERALQAVLDKLVDPAEFLDHVEYLYSHRKKKSREEVALKDGRILDRYSSPMIGSDKKYYGRVWYFRDITERKHADEEIRTAHQQLFDIIEFLPDATFVFDADKKVIAWNRAIEEMTGVTKEDILGKGDYTY
ncbi:MAG: PAS domain S-box protein, partial [Methanosarcinaceae archaeon]|nr:PAS domain S-box protein [Methanosarcinaceae archaeon]